MELDVCLGELFADAVFALLKQSGKCFTEVCAIGSHGQTISHQPFADVPHTLQIGDPNIIAERTGITTVADFRRRDIAAGGQGAPLAPALHAALFGTNEQRSAIVNIGGISNLTLFPTPASDTVIGFDCGPGNGLMDAWTNAHLGIPIDTDAAWAISGKINRGLLSQFMSDKYFALSAPKSTGKEYFNLSWVEQQLTLHNQPIDNQDVQRTLAELTICTIVEALENSGATFKELLVCGGGVHNPLLMAGLQEKLCQIEVKTTAAYGVDPDYLEACAFAWLAKQSLEHRVGNLPSVTGASRAVILGGVYPCG
tara:strand:- start:438 stop:1370 length:933 start_codon:yes stop_codon:yes gene_type:complete